MSFPSTPLGLVVELFIDGAWEDVTSYVYGGERDDVVITRGKTSEGSEVEPSRCHLVVNNRDGRFSPRNPTGAYYGLIGRNTPCRVRLTTAPARYLLFPAEFSEATAPDSANLSITGDIDIRVDIQRDDWTQDVGLASKYGQAGNQRSWALTLEADGTVRLYWSPDGTLAARVTATSTAAVTIPTSGRLAIRATLDVNNGAAGKTVTFYTSSTIDGTWAQLGSAVTTAGTTSIFDSTTVVGLGWIDIAGYDSPIGRFYGFELYGSLNGSSKRADVGLSLATANAGTFTDDSAVVWTLANASGATFTPAAIVTPDVRFVGEVSEWPQRWDVSGRDVWVPLEASGLLRRLTQGASPLTSTLYRGLTTLATPPQAYWPCEDGEDATSIASGLAGGQVMSVSGGADMAASSDFKCSSPIPVTTDVGQWSGGVDTYPDNGELLVWWLMKIPTAGAANGQSIVTIHTTGTVSQWDVIWSTGGSIGLQGKDRDGAVVLALSSFAFGIDGETVRFSLDMTQVGADIDWGLSSLNVGGGGALGGGGGTLAGKTFGRVTWVLVNPGGLNPDIAVGHIAVHDEVLSLTALQDQLDAYVGESALARIERLCEEQDVAFRAHGDVVDASDVGAQLPAELVTLLRDAADADGGILFEPRDFAGLAYRPRESLYRQAPRAELNYDSAHLSSIEPTDDDQHVRNDITVQRAGGSSARAVETDGPLSIEAPPDGVGRYDEAVTLNLYLDTQLEDAAGWRLHLGTVDEARFPTIGCNLARSVFVASSTLSRSVEDLDVGDRLTIADPPAWLPPDDISLLVQGTVETLGNFTETIDVNCAPETPYGQVAIYDDDLSRYTSDGTVTAEALDTTETGVDVTTASGPVWSHADGNFQIVVGGEVMTVTAISGAGSAQTLTVTRSVNSVVKSHASGAEVALYPTRVYVP